MAVYGWKHPLEIPPPFEKDWLREDEEDFFLQDPDRMRDALPQPFRMINKLVMLIFENAMEIIERREMLREAEKLKVQPAKCFPTAEFQVPGRANCLAVPGKYVFVGLSMGLAAFKVFDCKEVCAWDAAKRENCAIHASDLGNECHVLFAVDEMGLVWVLCFHKESFLLVKILNEMEDISQQSRCVEVVLSPGGDYARVLLQDSTKAWLEIYRLLKDSWLKEMEKNSVAAAGLAHRERRSSWTSVESPVSANKADAKLSLPVLLLKVKLPQPVTGSSSKNPLDALKKVDDASILGLGYNHLIKDSQWEQQEAIFRSTYQKYLEAEGEGESEEEIPRHATFHFLLPGRILQVGPEMRVQPGYPLCVTAILEERLIHSIHFLRSSAAASDETSCPGTDPAGPIVQLLVLCTDSSFYLVKVLRAGKSSITLLTDRQQSLLGLREQLPEYWSRLQAQAAAMDEEKQKVKGQKKL